MKALKIIGIAVFSLIAIFLILALIAPTDYKAESSTIINAPKEIVFNNVKHWKKWEKWSPWAELDPSIKVTFEGEDGTVGSKYIWSGDPTLSGEGVITATGIKENEEFLYHLHFKVPWESESNGYTRLVEKDGKTEVTWGFTGEFPFPSNIMLLFIDMQKQMEKPFSRGLELLKETSEKDFKELKSEVPAEEKTTMDT